MRLFALVCLCAAASSPAFLLEGLPGEEVTTPVKVVRTPQAPLPHPDSAPGVNWLAPPVAEQLARDPVLFTLGKGAVFVPTYSEPRREPEVAVFDTADDLVATGQTGHRILLDTGLYVLRFGSGASGHRLSMPVWVGEGHTTIPPLTWGGLLVETLTDSGDYIDGQYDLIRMENWTSYGRGNGFKEERLQDIKVWLLPPGLYRLSKTGEGFNSLRNYITVQINPGELHTIELIFDRSSGGNLIAGGAKTLNVRSRAGRNWVYGLRAGANADLARIVDESNKGRQNFLFSTDLRGRARFDNPRHFGVNEVFLQNSFLKEDNQPFSTTSDFLQLRSTWVRRLNPVLGPYVRGQVSTHIFPARLDLDVAYRVRTGDSAGIPVTDTLSMDTSGSFRIRPAFFPLYLAEGVGANLEWLSRYELALSTQLGLAARQQISSGDYLARTTNSFEKSQSTSTVGLEGILNGTLRISTRLTLDLRAEIFAENGKPGDTRLENLEADLRFFLIRNVEIGYLFQVRESASQVANRYPRQQNLFLRLSFNY